MILIVDSGSTKADWCFCENKSIIHRVQTPGINPYFHSAQSSPESLSRSLHPIYEGAIEAIYYYGTGVTGESAAAEIRDLLLEIFPETGEVEVSSDMLGAAKALFHKEKGIAVILGTGANSCFYNGTGITEQWAPLGFWLGDEGSGAYIGKQWIKMYLRKEIQEDIRYEFEKSHGVLSRLHILENAYQKPLPNRWFAGFAPFVIQHKGHLDCMKILGDSLSKLFERYLLKYRLAHEVKIGFVGSIAFHLQTEIKELSKKHKVELGEIIQSPMEKLVQQQ